jgi:CBS domain containing-hemolysin-like protein
VIELLIILALLLLNGIFALSELAIVSSRHPRLKALIAAGLPGARRALALASDPGRFLSTDRSGLHSLASSTARIRAQSAHRFLPSSRSQAE